MPRLSHSPLSVAVAILAAWAILGLPSLASAADSETRDFTIKVDGKPAGEYHMTISRNDDGTVSMAGQADVRLSFLGGLKTYNYNYRGTEVWKDGRLARFDSSSNDDGKRFTVNAVPENNSLRVKVNGQDHMSRPDVWVTTYWQLPAAGQRNQAIPLLDADTGRDINATLQYIGAAQVGVMGQLQNVAHWRLSGGVSVELYYDGQERLVRQEWVEDGHRSQLELARIRK
ncbi:MAG: hypothetical protein K2R98_18580 [Gemmataceae bacterium]|nr:hypothetical protein [Gemmataceae bacterium]